mgnify:CR=1 FL=1
MKNIYFFLLFFTLISSCKKVEDVIVDGNTIPPDHTIDNTIIENYINKLYISTIGREPIETEFNANFQTLRNADLSQSSREEVIDDVLSKVDYADNLFELESANILNGVDTSMINNIINTYEFILQTLSGIDSVFVNYELERMRKLQEVLPGLINESISTIETHKRMVNNYYYDEINMGTENFVVSIFQNFLNRYPTLTEVENSSQMVDGLNSSIFNINGGTKDDFIDIFFSSNEYYTGQTQTLFNRYLFRNPSSEESVDYSIEYISTGDYRNLQKQILSTDEFIGL